MPERVLIIDDEENIRQMLRLTLETADYEVGEAGDGMEAFAILGGDPAWNVVLLDQRLPIAEGLFSGEWIVIFWSNWRNRKGKNEPTCFDH
jgi:DNA-binding response OmpR family regulator